MRKFRWALGGLFVLITAIHGWVWLMDQDLYPMMHEQKQQNAEKKLVSIKKLRTKHEAEQKKERESYGWIEKDKGLARIPVARATTYYLRSLPRTERKR